MLFNFSGLSSSSGTIVGDDFAVDQKAGGAYKDYGSAYTGYGDFTGYDAYCLEFTNLDTTHGVKVVLKMNTGFTESPWGNATDDTYWQTTWSSGWIGPGETKTVSLRFNDAEVYNVEDDTVYTGYSNGQTGVTMWRLDEVSDIGFQVLGEIDNQDTSIKVRSAHLSPGDSCVPEFSTIAIPTVAMFGLLFLFNRRKYRKE